MHEANELSSTLRRPESGEVPFSSERKLMSTVHEDADKPERLIVFTKGAPDVLVSRCSHELVGGEARTLTNERRQEIRAASERLASEALRTLGVAFRSLWPDALEREVDGRVEWDLVFLGVVGMIDPPCEEAKEAVARAKSAGIRLLMITGDHPQTAAAIARELDITEDERAITGVELEKVRPPRYHGQQRGGRREDAFP
jgi:P-type Ca2+ transporter type 2C